MLFYAEPKRCIQQWVDAKTVVTLLSNGVAKCVRGSPQRLFALEAKAKAASPAKGERDVPWPRWRVSGGHSVNAAHAPRVFRQKGGATD